MASNPPAQCCTVGVRHEGTPAGKLETIEGTETYVARPEKPHSGKAILLITDVIGHKFVNVQLIADQFAANGYLTLIPDLFHGDPIPLNRPPGFDLQKWMKGKAGGGEGEGHLPPRVEPVVKAALKHLKEKEAATRIGTVGYCFGAKYVARALAKDGGSHAGYMAHPSFVESEELEAINGPLSIAAAETDQIFTVEKRHESEQILPRTKQPWQINLFSGVEHGFAVRGAIDQPQIKFAKEQAFYQAVQWFDTWLFLDHHNTKPSL